VNLRTVLNTAKRLRGPAQPSEPELDDPEYDDQEPELTDEDLAGRETEATPIESHKQLGDGT
jgi:hypothetical protein